MQNKKKLLLTIGVIVVVLAAALGIWSMSGTDTDSTDMKDISFTVVYADETSDEFQITTAQEFLRGALEDEGLIAGDETEYGLFVKTVNGVTADDANQEWWCLTKGGEAVETGVDSTPVTDGDAFEFTLTIGW